LQRATFLALIEADDIHQAMDRSPESVRTLLSRLAVEEPLAEPEDVVMQLVRDSARHELAIVTNEARHSTEAMTQAAAASVWFQQLDDPGTSTESARQLVAWIVARSDGLPGGDDA
jgi:hypothetical protein